MSEYLSLLLPHLELNVRPYNIIYGKCHAYVKIDDRVEVVLLESRRYRGSKPYLVTYNGQTILVDLLIDRRFALLPDGITVVPHDAIVKAVEEPVDTMVAHLKFEDWYSGYSLGAYFTDEDREERYKQYIEVVSSNYAVSSQYLFARQQGLDVEHLIRSELYPYKYEGGKLKEEKEVAVVKDMLGVMDGTVKLSDPTGPYIGVWYWLDGNFFVSSNGYVCFANNYDVMSVRDWHERAKPFYILDA